MIVISLHIFAYVRLKLINVRDQKAYKFIIVISESVRQ